MNDPMFGLSIVGWQIGLAGTLCFFLSFVEKENSLEVVWICPGSPVWLGLLEARAISWCPCCVRKLCQLCKFLRFSSGFPCTYCACIVWKNPSGSMEFSILVGLLGGEEERSRMILPQGLGTDLLPLVWAPLSKFQGHAGPFFLCNFTTNRVTNR